MPATITDRLNGLTTSVAVKAPCIAVASTNITLSGLQTVGAVALAAEDRVLVIGQTNTTQNGIYTADSGDWTRATDFDGPRDVVKGTIVLVANQFVEGAFYEVTSADPISFGTSAITFNLRDAPIVVYPITQAEISAGATPTDLTRHPGDFVRYGLSTAASGTVNAAAVNKALSSNSYCFCHDPGTYPITNTMNARSNQSVFLAAGVILQATSKAWGGLGFFRIDGVSNFQLQGGVFDGNKAVQPAGNLIGILMLASDNVRCIGVTAMNFPSDNVTLGSQGDGFYMGNTGAVVCTNIELIGCYSVRNVRQGLSIVQADGVAVIGGAYNETSGNNPGAGIDVEADPGIGDVRNVRIIGVELRGNQIGLVLTESSFNTTVKGCTVLASRGNSIALTEITNGVITGNYIEASGQTTDGAIVEIVNSDGVVFSDNVVQGAGVGATHERGGIRFTIGSSDISITNNVFKDTTVFAINVGSSALAGEPTNIVITGNTFSDCVDTALYPTTAVIAIGGNTVSSKYPRYLTIRNNIIRDTRGTPAGFGIQLQNIPAAVSALYRIDGNRIAGPTTAFDDNVSTVPPLCGLVTWNPASLVDAAGETSPNITVLGAALGDAVEVYPPYSMQGFVFCGYVSATDTVVIRIQNESGSTVDLASDSWRVRVRKLLQA